MVILGFNPGLKPDTVIYLCVIQLRNTGQHRAQPRVQPRVSTGYMDLFTSHSPGFKSWFNPGLKPGACLYLYVNQLKNTEQNRAQLRVRPRVRTGYMPLLICN